MKARRGGQVPPKGTVLFFCLSFVVDYFFRGRRVEEEEHPTMTAPAGRGQELGKKVCIKPAAAMALRAPCNGIQIKDNKQTPLLLCQ